VEIIKEASMGRIIGQKVKSTGKNHNPSFNRIRFHEFFFFVIRQTVNNICAIETEVPTLKTVLVILKEKNSFL
jgi:hypothetical protein